MCNNKNKIVFIPDLVLLDLKTTEAITIEGKKYEFRQNGINELVGYEAFDEMYLKKYYPEFSKPCKYRSCLHVKEDGCEIIELVNKGKIPGWRYDNYIKFIDEVSK